MRLRRWAARSFDAGADSRTVAQWKDRRIQLRVREKILVEFAHRNDIRIVRFRVHYFAAHQAVVDDGDSRKLEHRNDEVQILPVLAACSHR